jgi:hypothetical protein
MSQDHRRVIAKRVVENMEIRSADSAIGDLQLYLVWAATRLVNLYYVNVTFAACVLDESFHVAGPVAE